MKTCMVFLLAWWVFSVNATQLKIPEEFILTEHNGDKVFYSSLSHTSSIELVPGEHQFTFFYEAFIENDDDDSHAIVKSEPFSVVLTFDGDEDIEMQYEQALSLQQARDFAKQPVLVFVQNDRTLFFTMNAKLKENSERSKDALTPIVEVTDKSAHVKVVPLSMLKYWWSLATDKEKSAFLTSIEGDKQ